MENDVRLVIRAKNNLLLSRIEERGFSNIAAFCQFVNVSYAMLNGYICMRISPRMRNGDWRKPALDIAEALDANPEDLWSSEQQAMTEPVKVAEVVMSMAEYGRRPRLPVPLLHLPVGPSDATHEAEGNQGDDAAGHGAFTVSRASHTA